MKFAVQTNILNSRYKILKRPIITRVEMEIQLKRLAKVKCREAFSQKYSHWALDRAELQIIRRRS